MPASPISAAEAARRRVQRRRLRRWIMSLIFGIPLLLLAGALYLWLGPKPPPPPIVLPVSTVQAAQAEQNINAVRQALTAPQTVTTDAPASGAPQKTASSPLASHVQRHHAPDGTDIYTLQVSQADLNAYLIADQKLKQSLQAKGVHAVSIELVAPANIIVHANATLRGLTDNALIAATLIPDPKTGLHLNITDARFGRLPPPVVQAAANHVADQILGRSQTTLPLTVQKVEVQGTILRLTGVRRADSSPKH